MLNLQVRLREVIGPSLKRQNQIDAKQSHRIRRVKCDETKPNCQKCHSTGRKCDYFVDSPKASSHDLEVVHHVPGITEPTRLWKIPQLNEFIQEPQYRSLEFFQLYTTLCFGKDAGFYLLQAVHHEPIIRTIAIAIGSLHRSFVHNDKGVATREETRFTLQHYNKAIRQLIAMDHETSLRSNDTFLIACILFYCFECLQGHYYLAVQHGISGLKIINQQQMLATSQYFPSYMPRETVNLIFSILENQIIEMEGDESFAVELQPALFSPSLTPAFDPFHPPSTIEGMRTCFELLYNKLTRFLSACELMEGRFEGSEFEFLVHMQYVEEEHIRVRTDLEAWMVAFDTWIGSSSATHSAEPHSIIIVKIWRLTISVLLRLEWPISELSWDEHTDSFARVISLVSDLLDFPYSPGHVESRSVSPNLATPPIQDTTPSLPPLRPKPVKTLVSTFSMSLGIVTPLYICVARCRDSSIRHRAVDILSTCQRREGLWDAKLTGRITRRIVEIEEAAAGIEPGTRYTPSCIGLAARVRSVTLQFGQERAVKVRYNRVAHDTDIMEETVTW